MKQKQILELSNTQKGLLLALCLGDGCLRKPHPKTGAVQLEIGHSIQQLEYCKYKRDLVYSILGGKNPPKIGIKNIKINNKEYTACRFTKTNDYFIALRKKLYPYGRKTITRELLNMLSEQGLAIWYMDNGSCYYKESEVDGHSICIDLRISTDCFTKEEHEIIVDYFREVWNINFYVFYSKSRDVYCIRANKQAAIKFINLIKPYVIPEMQYKCSIKLQERETSLKDDDIV